MRIVLRFRDSDFLNPTAAIDRDLAGIYSFNVFIEGMTDSMLRPETLVRIERLSDAITKLPRVRKGHVNRRGGTATRDRDFPRHTRDRNRCRIGAPFQCARPLPRAALTTAIISSCGFSVLMLSEYKPSAWFGGLLALTLGVAFLSEILVLPATISLVSRMRARPNRISAVV